MASSSQPTAVAVSGGADSLYTLIRLQERGLPVIAAHGLFFPPSPEKREAQARLAAACDRLGVQLHVFDLIKEFDDLVIRPFVQAYADGLTPNPCAGCNAGVKFGLLLDKARSLGAAFLATGHYARLTHPERLRGDYPYFTQNETGAGRPDNNLMPAGALPDLPALYQGADAGRDQSYFLALTPADRLASAVFPLGESLKKDVLATLERRGIQVPQPGESREVCFVPNDAYREFLPAAAARLGISLPGEGEIRLPDGPLPNRHKGLWRYTEGQRRGLGIAWKEPLYVLAKECAANRLLVGTKEEQRTLGCVCNQVNILLPPELWPEEVLVKVRYRQAPVKAAVSVLQAMHIRFSDRENAVAPGQVAAVYVPVPGREEKDGRPLLQLAAGGVIAHVERG